MIVKHMEQGSPDWFETRRGRPTASNFDRIVTASTGMLSMNKDKTGLSQGALSYVRELLGEIGTPGSIVPPGYVSPAMIQGIQLEPEARKWYCFERDCEVQQCGICLSDDGRFGASPDALVGDDGLLELKCPQPKAHVGYILDGKLPDDYKQQCHGQLWVTGRKWVDFVSYCNGFDPFIVRVVPDAYTKKLGDALEGFWIQYAIAFGKIFPAKGPLKLSA